MRHAERGEKLAGSLSPPQHRVPSVLPFEAQEHAGLPNVEAGERSAELAIGLLGHRQEDEGHWARSGGPHGGWPPDHESQVPHWSERAPGPGSEAEVITEQDFGRDPLVSGAIYSLAVCVANFS